MVYEVESVSEQIRKICPAGAIGYRIQVYEPTPESYPLKRSGSLLYAIDPEGVEYPVGVPPGDHQVIFLDKSSRAIKAYKNPVITIEKPRRKKPVATEKSKQEEPKEAEETEGPDIESEVNAAAAGFVFDFSGDYQKRVQDHDIYRKRIRLAKESRYTAELAELQANVTACHDETLRKILLIDKTQIHHNMAQISLTAEMAELYKKMPQPAPPPAAPMDWNALLKTAIDGISGIIQTFGSKRHEQDRALFAREVAEAVTAVATSQHVGALPADRPDKADKRDNDKADDDKSDNGKSDNDKADNDKADNDKSDNDKADNDKADNDKSDNDKADSGDRGEKADKRGEADNDRNQSSRSESAEVPFEKKTESVISYSSAWRSMRRAILSLTDQHIVQMVAHPVLLVAFVASLGSMAPQRPRLDRQATIYLPALRR